VFKSLLTTNYDSLIREGHVCREFLHKVSEPCIKNGDWSRFPNKSLTAANCSVCCCPSEMGATCFELCKQNILSMET
jgi:hypothetical protein